MPVPKGTKFRMTQKGGRTIRLAIHRGEVVETKDMGPAKKKTARNKSRKSTGSRKR